MQKSSQRANEVALSYFQSMRQFYQIETTLTLWNTCIEVIWTNVGIDSNFRLNEIGKENIVIISSTICVEPKLEVLVLIRYSRWLSSPTVMVTFQEELKKVRILLYGT